MGPHDPFATATGPDRPTADGNGARAHSSASPTRWREQPVGVVAGGLIGGVLVGVSLLAGLFAEVLFVLLCGGLGAGVAWLVYGGMTGRLQWRRAWRVLRDRP